MPSVRTRNRWQLALLVGLGGILLSSACGSGSNPAALGGNSGADSGYGGGSCDTPHPGCPCSDKGQSVACGEVVTHDQDGVTCAEGTTICDGSQWGTCQISSTMFKSLHPIGLSTGSSAGSSSTLHPLDLQDDASADGGGCSTDPCDPSCQGFVDNSNGVDAGPGLVPDEGGWTLPLQYVEGGACQGLQCQIPSCPSGTTAAITGTVWDPAAINPVYNAAVMIPNGAVQPIPAGVSNDPCGGASLPPAVTYAYSDTSGHFTLTNVPIGASIPLVIQLGRWRRVTTIDTSAVTCLPVSQATNISVASGCGDPSPGLNNYAGTAGCTTRFPRVQGDGNIPKMAIGTGGLDAIECMLYRMGVSSSEYTDENGTGRINIFNDGGAKLAAPNANHDISYLLGFSCQSSTCPVGAIASQTTTNIKNPSFENGLTNWTKSGASETSSNTTAHAGTFSALLGSTSPTNGDSTVKQANMTAPAGVNALTFWASINCNDVVTSDWFTASFKDNTSGGTQNVAHTCPAGNTAWTMYSFWVKTGHSYTLTMTNHDDNNPGDATWTYVDDVAWTTYSNPVSELPNYDLVMLPCDGGGEYNSTNWGAGLDYDDNGRQNLVDYAGEGGRIFTSHWGREWIERASTALPTGPFPGVADWINDGSGGAVTGVIDTTQTYGQNFDAWMQAVGATANTLITINPQREDTDFVVTANSRQFVYYQADGYPADFTFDTPVGSGMPVGRVMYTDMHLANGTPSGTFPTNCPTQGSALLQQEDAAEYLLFDLGSCVTGLPIPVGSQQFNPSTFTRDYNAVCPSGYRPRWRYFQWSDTLPSDTNIVFQAWTADTEAQLGTQYTPPLPVTLATSTASNPGPANPMGSPPNPSYGVDVDPALVTGGVPSWNASTSPPSQSSSYAWLRVAMTLNPSTDKHYAPTLSEWQQTYDCVAAE